MIGYSKYIIKLKHQAIPTKIKQIKEFDDLQQNYQILFFVMKGVGGYMSCYDDSFDEEQFALYNYDATYRNVRSLFNKYGLFKNKVSEVYKKLGNTSRQIGDKVDIPSFKNDSTARYAEQLISLKDFIEYCDEVINKNIKNLNYYEKWIFDEVLIRGKNLSSIANDKKCDRSYVYLSKKKKSCVLKISMWFDIYVLNDNVMKELKSYKDYNDL